MADARFQISKTPCRLPQVIGRQNPARQQRMFVTASSHAFAAASFRSAPETPLDMGSQPCEYGSPHHEDND
jgi:hypothetical protein